MPDEKFKLPPNAPRTKKWTSIETLVNVGMKYFREVEGNCSRSELVERMKTHAITDLFLDPQREAGESAGAAMMFLDKFLEQQSTKKAEPK